MNPETTNIYSHYLPGNEQEFQCHWIPPLRTVLQVNIICVFQMRKRKPKKWLAKITQLAREKSRTLNMSCTAFPAAAAAAKSLQLCLTLCDPRDGSPPGSPIPGILQARTLEWVAISFSNAWKWKVKVKLLSRIWLLATPWTTAYQAPLSMGFARQEYWSGVPLPSPPSPSEKYIMLFLHKKY